MNSDVCLPDKSQIAREILTYLEKQPDAQDTLEGILQTWFADRRDRYTPTRVREVVKDLVMEGTLVENTTQDEIKVYMLNHAKRDKMKKLAEQAKGIK